MQMGAGNLCSGKRKKNHQTTQFSTSGQGKNKEIQAQQANGLNEKSQAKFFISIEIGFKPEQMKLYAYHCE
jgi:hypothetical protein